MIAFDLSAPPLADSRIATLKSIAEAAVRGAIVQGLDRIAADARANVAALRDPGRPDPSPLAASIATSLGDDGLSGTVAAGGATAPYAPYVEFGTTRAPAQPFLGPAFAANASRIQDDVASALGDAIGGAA